MMAAPERTPESYQSELTCTYGRMREALVVFFRRSGIFDPEDLAQDVFVRVIQKLGKGLKIERSAEQFCWRVARFVRQEQYRRRKFVELAPDTPAPDRSILGLQDIETGVLLNECMGTFSARDFDFVQRYLHQDKESLARQLNTNPAAMAIRFYKLKKRLEEFVRSGNS